MFSLNVRVTLINQSCLHIEYTLITTQLPFSGLNSLGPVHTTPVKFENGGFTLKTHQMFSVHTRPEELKNATIIGHFGFVFKKKKTWAGKSRDYRGVIVFKKLRF